MSRTRRNPKQLPKHERLQQDLRLRLDTLCVDWGFFIPPDRTTAIAIRERISAGEFTSEVLLAEAMAPKRHHSVSVDDYDLSIGPAGE